MVAVTHCSQTRQNHLNDRQGVHISLFEKHLSCPLPNPARNKKLATSAIGRHFILAQSECCMTRLACFQEGLCVFSKIDFFIWAPSRLYWGRANKATSGTYIFQSPPIKHVLEHGFRCCDFFCLLVVFFRAGRTGSAFGIRTNRSTRFPRRGVRSKVD